MKKGEGGIVLPVIVYCRKRRRNGKGDPETLAPNSPMPMKIEEEEEEFVSALFCLSYGIRLKFRKVMVNFPSDWEADVRVFFPLPSLLLTKAVKEVGPSTQQHPSSYNNTLIVSRATGWTQQT